MKERNLFITNIEFETLHSKEVLLERFHKSTENGNTLLTESKTYELIKFIKASTGETINIAWTEEVEEILGIPLRVYVDMDEQIKKLEKMATDHEKWLGEMDNSWLKRLKFFLFKIYDYRGK